MIKPDAIRNTEATLGAAAVSWRPVTTRIGNERGRWLVELANGSSVFVKAPYDDASAEWLRVEALVYEGVQASFMPRLVAWDGELLILEDLSDATWPPHWTHDAVDAVRSSLNELAQVNPPDGLPSLAELRPELVEEGWPVVEQDPGPFLSLGLCTAGWLREALPTLIECAKALPVDGSSLVHVDIRSDNLCIRNGTALFFDWNWASIGNPVLDLAAWLPSLHAEGGPPPETLLPGSEGAPYAAALAGYFAARAGLPTPVELPRLREVQALQLSTALSWAARCLGLPAPTS